ncbi:DNA polymerase III subunit delta [Arvimicrobium flavum]|uniref:DNA polymerase III subunit delta n=1 Tax=Arvimicrobium flavum TaxID=3393320 RepID=UPI00237C49A6|nr:DNA polymerase III subunit delta [Mesorhizobium shangrilense]
MAQKKSHEVDAWLARSRPEASIVLCYGPDRGLVSERAERFAKSTGLPLDDPFVVVKLDASTLEKDPGRLLDEAHAVAMFAAQRLIWIRGAGADRRLADDVKALIARPAADAVVLIEAGDLKKGAALRSVVEGGASSMALPCYADEGRDLDRLIDEELGNAGLSIGLDARRVLRDSLGGDRRATRSELHKLVLYMAGRTQIERSDVECTVSDVSASSVDEVIDAALAGDMPRADAALSRALSAQGATFQVLSALMRQVQALHLMRGAVDAGVSPGSVVASARPPIFFSRRQLIERALGSWPTSRSERTLTRLQALVLATRKRPELAAPAIRQAVLGITAESSAAARGR